MMFIEDSMVIMAGMDGMLDKVITVKLEYFYVEQIWFINHLFL